MGTPRKHGTELPERAGDGDGGPQGPDRSRGAVARIAASWLSMGVLDKIPTAWRAVALVPAGLILTGALGGCLGDPPPDPATAPLEVVLDGCALNRPDVAPGTHQIALVGSGELVVDDESGQEVHRTESGGELVTEEGTYTFTCTVGDDTSTTTLESAP